jgi:hypothetical protein
MAKIANVALTNTFDTWRSRSNEAFDRLSQFAINNSSLYANTLTANSSFTSKGLGTFNGRVTIGTNLNVSGNTTFGGAGKISNTTGWFGVAGRASVSTNLFVGGNTAIGGGQGLGGKFSVQSGFSYFATQAGNYNTALFGPRPANDGYGTLNFNWTTNGTGNFWIIDYSPGAFAFNAYKAGTSIPIMTLANTGGVNMQKSLSVTQNLTVSGNTIIGSSGRLGIGIAVPDQPLHVYSAAATGLYNHIEHSGAHNSGVRFHNSQGSWYSYIAAGGNQYEIYGGTTPSVKLSIAGSGLVTVPSITVTNQITAGNTVLTGTTTDNSNALAQTLTDGATINWDVSLGRVATVTLGAAGRTMAAPTNLKVGTYILRVYQDGTGSRTITSWNAVFKWTAAVAPVLSTGAGKLDIITFFSDGTNLYGSYLPDMR